MKNAKPKGAEDKRRRSRRIVTLAEVQPQYYFPVSIYSALCYEEKSQRPSQRNGLSRTSYQQVVRFWSVACWDYHVNMLTHMCSLNPTSSLDQTPKSTVVLSYHSHAEWPPQPPLKTTTHQMIPLPKHIACWNQAGKYSNPPSYMKSCFRLL